MGFFRGALLFLVNVLFILFLLALYSFATLSSSLEYQNVQEEISPLVENFTNMGIDSILGDGSILGGEVSTFLGEDFNLSQEIEENLDEIEAFCLNNSGAYDLGEFGYELNIPCENIPEDPVLLVQEKVDIMVNETVHDFVEEIYYEDYPCEFWDCFGQQDIPFFLVSEKAQQYWQQKFYISLVVCIVFAFLIFLLVEKKINYPILLGSLILFPAIPFLKLISLLSFLDSFIVKILSIFVSKSYQVFWTGFIVGLVLIIFGILLYTVLAGTKIANWFQERSSKKKEDSKVVEKEAPTKKDSVKEEKIVKPQVRKK